MKKCFDIRKSLLISCAALMFISFLFFSCKKKDSVNPPLPPGTVLDSSFKITTATQTDINDFDISYQVSPPAGDSYSNLYLQWSTDSTFASGDSILISNAVTSAVNGKLSLKRLKQAATYFSRLSLVYKDKKFYSVKNEFKTDTLKLIAIPTFIGKGSTSSITTNFKATPAGLDTSTRVYLNDVLCRVLFTNGELTQFSADTTFIPGKYKLMFERNGISVQAPDSLEVTKGYWSAITPPVIPAAPPTYPENAIFLSGTCYSDQKGYIIPGTYFHTLPTDDPKYGKSPNILSFDGITNQWTEIIPTNPNKLRNPTCYYYDNGIYVIAGQSMKGGIHEIQKLMKFELGTNTWINKGDLPYATITNQVSFAYNNQFYIGLGSDRSNVDPDTGIPLPSYKFRRYNPLSGSWKELADFPGSFQYSEAYPTAFTIGSKAYVFFGAIPIGDPATTLDFRQELWQYDIETNVWTQLNLPAAGGPPIGEKYQIVSYNNKAYFLTCQRRTLSGSVTDSPCLEYNPVDGSFRQITPIGAPDILKLLFVNGNKFYFQADAAGYYESVPNRTYLLTLE